MSVEYKGPHDLSLAKLLGRLIDLDNTEKLGMRPDREGFEEVVHELAQVMVTYGATAGIPKDAYDHLLMCNETVEFIDEALPLVLKLAEVLKESRLYYVDARQNDIAMIVDAIRSRAQRRKDESILTPFEKTIKYNGQVGFKAAKTRRKNAEQAEAEAKEQAEVQAAAQVRQAEAATQAQADMEKQLADYKAELEAKFHEAVNAAVERRLSTMTPMLGAGPSSQRAPASQSRPS